MTAKSATALRYTTSRDNYIIKVVLWWNDNYKVYQSTSVITKVDGSLEIAPLTGKGVIRRTLFKDTRFNQKKFDKMCTNVLLEHPEIQDDIDELLLLVSSMDL